jgi:hypothetical protein
MTLSANRSIQHQGMEDLRIRNWKGFQRAFLAQFGVKVAKSVQDTKFIFPCRNLRNSPKKKTQKKSCPPKTSNKLHHLCKIARCFVTDFDKSNKCRNKNMNVGLRAVLCCAHEKFVICVVENKFVSFYTNNYHNT